MHRNHLIILITPLLLLSSCGIHLENYLSRDPIPLSEEQVTSEKNSLSEESILEENSEEVSSTAPITINDISWEDSSAFFSNYYAKLSSFESYKAVTQGQTVSTVLFIKVEQSIDVTTFKSDYSYMKNESHSSMVNTSHEAYYHGSSALYRDNDEKEFTKASLDEYLSIYGTYPFEKSFEGFKTSEDAILSFNITKVDKLYCAKISFDPEKSTTNVRIQMRKFGGLDDYPVFSSIEVCLYLQEDFTPSYLELASSYKAKKLTETNCEQNYTLTYSDFNKEQEIPDLDVAKSLF